jgi:hypothetical protein
LIVVILAILLLVSYFTAAPAKAPTVPLTPTPPPLTPSAAPTPSAGATRTSPPTTRPKPTHTKKEIAVADRPPGLALRLPSKPPDTANAVASRNGREVAYIPPAGDAYARSPVKIWSRASGVSRTISYADRFVRPVWSSDGTRILFVRVTQTPAYPGALWTLLEADARSGSVRVLDRQNGLNMLPLGWRDGRPLYLVSTATDSSLFSIVGGKRHFISILMPQVITAAFLSRDAKYVAFAAPSDCFFCTYDTFNLDMLHPLVGPSGGHNENNIAWARHGDDMAVPLKDRIGIVRAETVGVVTTYPLPAGLPPIWTHPMTFRRTAHKLTLTDTVTRATYTSTR